MAIGDGMTDWVGVPLDRVEEWQAAFLEDLLAEDIQVPCPICGRVSLHRWYDSPTPRPAAQDDRRFIGRGALWEWCSVCRAYEHYSALVPKGWHSTLAVETGQLTAEPEAIERARCKRTAERG